MRQIKLGAFVIEGMSSFATTIYFFYFYFFTQKQLGFGGKENLILAAVGGLVYMPAAYFGGKLAQKAGYFTALNLGFGLMIASMLAGWLWADTMIAHIVLMFIAMIGVCFTWPALEALVSEGETYHGLQRNVGTYNVTWASANAVAIFVGGALLEKLSIKSLFFVPAAIISVQLVMSIWLQRKARGVLSRHHHAAPAAPPHSHTPARTKAFMRMAWLANPSAYLAINTLVAVMPDVAGRLQLSTTMAGFFGSLWGFSRLATFMGLWVWTDWHYRFRWLLGSYIALIISFAMILLVPNLLLVAVAQLAFGGAVGLMYYSSLFYSMDVGDTKGEHGGIHEAAIGLGNFAGPAVGAASLHFLPQYPTSGSWAVTAVLVCGLGGLAAIWRGARQ
jgi:predicted MFS family arabinose efflux permease